MLGHKSAAMTLDAYADLFDKDAEAVADAHDQPPAGVTLNADVVKMQPKTAERSAIGLSTSS